MTDVEHPDRERQHAAGHVGVHQPDRPHCQQSEINPRVDEFA